MIQPGTGFYVARLPPPSLGLLVCLGPTPFGLLQQCTLYCVVYKQQVCIPYSSAGWEAKIKVPAGLASGEGSFLARWHQGAEEHKLPQACSKRALSPLMRAKSSLSKSLPLYAVALVIRISMQASGGHINQTI